MKLLTKLYVGIGLILAIFAIVTLSYLRQSGKVENDMEQVLVSTEVLRNSEALQKSLIDMETGFRGFLLTGRETFLEPFYAGHNDGNGHYTKIRQLEKDPEQLKLLEKIGKLEEHWVEDFAEDVILAKKQSLKDPSKEKEFDKIYNREVIAGKGKAIMDKIRTQFALFDQFELRQKETRTANLQKSLTYTRYFSLGLTLFAIFLGTLIAFLLGRTVRQRLTAMIDLADHISKGDFEVVIEDTKNDEMSRLSKSLNLMAAKLKSYFTNLNKVNKELDQFAYVVSHDLKAPLRAINNLAEWISEDIKDPDPEIRNNLQLMRGRVHRMENLINGILEYSKVGRKDVPTETFEVKKLLEEIVDSLALPPNFQIILPENAPVLTTEKIFMIQVFSNLISNGIKYNDKPAGQITISVQPTQHFYEFTVTDNGPGIPAQYYDRIFGVFQTMEARDTLESTGVGLAIVKKIIDEKGGRIRIESKENEFTSFIFSWPKVNSVKH